MNNKVKEYIDRVLNYNGARNSKIVKVVNEGKLDCFGEDIVVGILANTIKYNYDIDLDVIFNVISPEKYLELYNNINGYYNVCYKNFDIYNFIKITNYFINNIDILENINNYSCYDIALMIIDNKKDKSIYNSKMSKDEKLKKLTGYYDIDAISKFLDNIGNSYLITKLQLFYKDNSYEYNVLEYFLQYIKVVESLYYDDFVDESKIIGYINNPLFRLDNIRKNLLYINMKVFTNGEKLTDRLDKKGKYIINDKNIKIYLLDDVDFFLLSHDEEFSDTWDFTDSPDTWDKYFANERVRVNYICTSYDSSLVLINTHYGSGGGNNYYSYYDIDDAASVISYGDCDICIHPTVSPFFESKEVFADPIEMYYPEKKPNYTSNEVDLFRNYNGNDIKSLHFVSSLSSLKIYDNEDIYFYLDNDKVNKSLEDNYNRLLNNIDNLSYREWYKLLKLCNIKRNRLSDEQINIIYNNLKNDKERMVFDRLVNKYIYSLDKEDIKKHIK